MERCRRGYLRLALDAAANNSITEQSDVHTLDGQYLLGTRSVLEWPGERLDRNSVMLPRNRVLSTTKRVARQMDRYLIWFVLFLGLLTTGCSGKKLESVCDGRGECCNIYKDSGGYRSFCVSSCSECIPGENEKSQCPERSSNRVGGCNPKWKTVKWWESRDVFSGSGSYALSPSLFEKFSAAKQSGQFIKVSVEVAPSPDCADVCLRSSPLCEHGRIAEQSENLKSLFSDVLAGGPNQTISYESLTARFNQDPTICRRDEIIVSDGQLSNHGESCNVTASIEELDETVTLTVPSELQASVSTSESSIELRFESPAQSPRIAFQDEAKNETFSGSLTMLRATNKGILAGTPSRCFSLQY